MRDLDGMKQERDQTRAELDETKAKLGSVEKELHETKADYNGMKNQRDEMKKKIICIDFCNYMMGMLRKERDRKREELRQSKIECDGLRRKHESFVKEIDCLKKENLNWKVECMQLRLKMLEKELTLGQIRCNSCHAKSSTGFPTKVAESSKLVGAGSSVKCKDDDAVKAKQSLSDHSGDRVDNTSLHSGSHLNTVLAR